MINNKVLRRIGKIIALVGLTLGSLISLVYLFTNIRIIFSGDFMVYASSVGGFFRSFFNIMMYLFIIGMTVFAYFYLVTKKVQHLKTFYWICNIGLLLVVTTHLAFNKLSFSSGLEGYLIVAYHIVLVVGVVGQIMVFLTEPKE